MTLPIVIIDKRAPFEAKSELQKHFIVVEFLTEDITYDAIKGHPDIFIFQNKSTLVLAPNIPQEYIDIFNKNNISYCIGNKHIGYNIANSTQYNCTVFNNRLFHNKKYTDTSIQKLYTQHVNIAQAYTRCSMIFLPNGSCITSDKGICKVLEKEKIDFFWCNPHGIFLPPYKNGFIGGCLGIFDNTVFIIGSLSYIENGSELRTYIEQQNLKVHELYNGPLYDGGGLFFM